MMQDRKYVNTRDARTIEGPWSQGVRAGGLVFTSGQVPIEPDTGRLVEGGVREQVDQSLMNVTAILNSAGASLDDVVKVTVYLLDYGDFDAVNEAYGEYFGPNYPARTLITAKELPVVAGEQVRVIIEAVAHIGYS